MLPTACTYVQVDLVLMFFLCVHLQSVPAGDTGVLLSDAQDVGEFCVFCVGKMDQ